MAKYKSLRQMTDKEATIRVQGDFTRYEAKKQSEIKRCRRYEAIYKALNNPELIKLTVTGKPEDDARRFSDTYMPIGAAIVDAVISKLYNAFFSTPHYLMMEAKEWEDKIRAFLVTGHLMTRHREMHFKDTIFKTLLQAACFDYAITCVKWKLEEGHITRRKNQTVHREYGSVIQSFDEVKVEEVWVPNAVDRSDVCMINYFNCYHDPDSENGFEDSEAFIDIRDEKIETLKMKAKNAGRPWGKYKNIGAVLRQWGQDNKVALDEIKKRQLTDEHKSHLIDSRRVTVTRYWTREHIVEMALGKVIWRKDITGWPLQRWVIFEQPDPSFNGMGVLQRMERNQYDINSSINNRRDFENLVTDPIAVLDDDIIGPEGEPELYHGKIFVNTAGSKPAKDTIFIHSPGAGIAPAMGLDLAAQMDAIEKVTVSENALGAYKGTGRRTATETLEVKQGTISKTTQRAGLLEENCLEEIYVKQFVLESILLSQEERFTYFGKQGNYVLAIRPRDYAFNRQPGFHAMGTLSMLKEPIEFQQFLLAMERAMMMPELHNWPNIFGELWSRCVPKHSTSFVKDPRVREENIPPKIENLLFSQGRNLKVSPLNKHPEHLREHEAYKRTADYATWPQIFKTNLENHIIAHQQQSSAMARIGTHVGESRMTQDVSDPLRGIRPAMTRTA